MQLKGCINLFRYKMSDSNLDNFPVLHIGRLLLRPLEGTDDEVIFRIRSNKDVYKYIAKQTQKSISEARAFIAKTNKGVANGEIKYWGIVLKETNELIGDICLWNFSKDGLTAEIGYELYPDYHRKGIMNEAVKRIIAFGFESLKLKSIEAYTHKDNEGSKTLLQKHKFKLDTSRTDVDFPNNLIYVLTK